MSRDAVSSPLGWRNEGISIIFRPKLLARLLIALVRVYQLTLSPWLGKVCRFEPSCSRYAVACLEGHGAIRGSLLSVKRLCKCHPFHPGGFDPPPSAAPTGGAKPQVREVA